jgi:hypothetical protein
MLGLASMSLAALAISFFAGIIAAAEPAWSQCTVTYREPVNATALGPVQTMSIFFGLGNFKKVQNGMVYMEDFREDEMHDETVPLSLYSAYRTLSICSALAAAACGIAIVLTGVSIFVHLQMIWPLSNNTQKFVPCSLPVNWGPGLSLIAGWLFTTAVFLWALAVHPKTEAIALHQPREDMVNPRGPAAITYSNLGWAVWATVICAFLCLLSSLTCSRLALNKYNDDNDGSVQTIQTKTDGEKYGIEVNKRAGYQEVDEEEKVGRVE